MRWADSSTKEAGSRNPRSRPAADDWIITLDTYTQSSGNTSSTYTRLRAPYFNPEGFRFEIYRAGFFSEVGKALGMQDIEVGHKRFDDDFVIKSNRPRRVRRLFDNAEIRRLIDVQPRIHLSVKGHEGVFSRYPAGVDELYFQAPGTIKDRAHLRHLFDLFAEVLQQVCHEGKAYEDDVRIHIRRLSAPGGQIEYTRLLWEGDEPRHDAAAALGRLRDPVSVRFGPSRSFCRTTTSGSGPVRSKRWARSDTGARSGP